MNKTHGSLFSGFDAPSVAASWMGWKNAFHCEINSFCNEILKYWFPDSEHYEDITKTDFSQWKGRIDVLTGGFPCQPFSLAGQRKGADDNRYLWPEMLRAIREIRPLGLLVKTLLESSQWFSPARRLKWEAKPLFSEKITEKEYCYDKSMSSKPSVKTLNEKDILSNRCLFRLVPSERPTEETECGLLLTGMMLPTPTSIDAGTGRINKSRSPNAKERPTIALAAKMGLLPTPTASSHHNGCCKERKDGTSRKSELNHYISAQTGKNSQLNPLFVEEMMGFPLMWTTLPFLSKNGDRNQSKDMEMP